MQIRSVREYAEIKENLVNTCNLSSFISFNADTISIILPVQPLL